MKIKPIGKPEIDVFCHECTPLVIELLDKWFDDEVNRTVKANKTIKEASE